MDIQPDLSVCVAGPLEQEALGALLHSLYATADPLAVEAVVMTDQRTAAALQGVFPQAVLYESEQIEPVTAAGNRALRLARGRYLALVTAAVVFHAGALPRLLTFLDDHPEVGLASPHLQTMSGTGVAAAGIFPSLPRFLAGIARGAISGRRLPDFLYHPAFSREVDWLHTPCLLMRREVIEELGLPAENSELLWDLEYGWRSHQAGWRSFFLRESLVFCETRPRLLQRPEGALLLEGMNYFLRKWSGRAGG